MLSVSFFLDTILLGLALSMDAFSISLANGLRYPNMTRSMHALIAGVFALFQMFMPMLGWLGASTLVYIFQDLRKAVPVITLVILAGLGIKMICDCFSCESESCKNGELTITVLFLQGIADSLDALSVGFTFVEYSLSVAFLASAIIGIITFSICAVGVSVGKIIGLKFSKYAAIFGGSILIILGIKIFVEDIF